LTADVANCLQMAGGDIASHANHPESNQIGHGRSHGESFLLARNASAFPVHDKGQTETEITTAS
jgi:hypothetical protein